MRREQRGNDKEAASSRRHGGGPVPLPLTCRKPGVFKKFRQKLKSRCASQDEYVLHAAVILVNSRLKRKLQSPPPKQYSHPKWGQTCQIWCAKLFFKCTQMDNTCQEYFSIKWNEGMAKSTVGTVLHSQHICPPVGRQQMATAKRLSMESL